MKKTLTALLTALVLVLTMACGAAGETAADLEQAVSGTWEITEITGVEGEDDESLAAAIAAIRELGGTMVLTFADGVCTMKMSVMGQTQTQKLSYRTEDGRLNLGGTPLETSFSGEQMILTDNGAIMVLTKTEAPAEPEGAPESAGELAGRWQVAEVTAAEGSDQTLAYRIKEYFDNGGVFVMTFRKTTVSLDLADGESDKADYTADGETLVIGNDITAGYYIDDAKRLHIIEEQDEIVLDFLGYALDGKWNVTGVSGDAEGVSEFNQILEMGGVIYMVFDDGQSALTMEFMGQSMEQDLGEYTDLGNSIEKNGMTSAYAIDGDTLTLDEEGLVMTMVRAE